MTGSPVPQNEFVVRTDPAMLPRAEQWKAFYFADVPGAVTEGVKDYFESAMENGPDNNMGQFFMTDSRKVGEVFERIDFDKLEQMDVNNNQVALDSLRIIRRNLFRVLSIDGDEEFPKYANRAEVEAGMAEVVEASQMFLKPQAA